MRLSLPCLTVALALLGHQPAHAQSSDPLHEARQTALPLILRVDASSPPAAGHAILLATQPQPGEGRPTWLLAAGGVAGGGVGLVAGMLIGALVDGPPDEDCRDFCFGPGLILGTLVGEVAGVSLGVHLANGRRGSLPLGVLTSAGIFTLGALIALEAPEIVLGVPVAQIIGAIRVERITGRGSRR